jgi:beta-glucanase (GH16 family)
MEICGTGVGGASNTKNDLFVGTWTSEDWANDHTSTSVVLNSPEVSFFYYKFVWTVGQVLFYVNGNLVATIVSDVPSHIAPAFINHWGTDFTGGWGGVATPGTVRWMWVSMFRFTPA